jgi:hypothetical protein
LGAVVHVLFRRRVLDVSGIERIVHGPVSIAVSMVVIDGW